MTASLRGDLSGFNDKRRKISGKSVLWKKYDECGKKYQKKTGRKNGGGEKAREKKQRVSE